jgi:hypothetical protein
MDNPSFSVPMKRSFSCVPSVSGTYTTGGASLCGAALCERQQGHPLSWLVSRTPHHEVQAPVLHSHGLQHAQVGGELQLPQRVHGCGDRRARTRAAKNSSSPSRIEVRYGEVDVLYRRRQVRTITDIG